MRDGFRSFGPGGGVGKCQNWWGGGRNPVGWLDSGVTERGEVMR